MVTAELAEQVYNALLCDGEEPECWASPGAFAELLGIDKYTFEDAVAYLQVHNRIHARYEANGSLYVRQREGPITKE